MAERSSGKVLALLLLTTSASAFLTSFGPVRGSYGRISAASLSRGPLARPWFFAARKAENRKSDDQGLFGRGAAGGAGILRSARMSSLGTEEKVEIPQRVKDFLNRIPGGNSLRALESAEKVWSMIRSDAFTRPPPSPAVIELPDVKLLDGAANGQADYDVIVCGGTLGIFFGAALALRGWKVAVVEQGKLVGRTQEWNISRRELEVLVELGILTTAQLAAIAVTEYNPQRVGFAVNGGQYELATIRGVLNLGVDPVLLIELVKSAFLAAGGKLYEETGFRTATVGADAVKVSLTTKPAAASPTPAAARGAGGDAAFDPSPAAPAPAIPAAAAAGGEGFEISGRIVLDGMGNLSPIMRQARGYSKADGVCVVVGSCARGDWIDNSYGDLIYSFTPIKDDRQYFWEAFPSKDLHGSKEESRTTYMFAYLDAHPQRASLGTMFNDYLDLLPSYPGAQSKGVGGGVAIPEEMKVSRALVGIFPSYTDSPLMVKFDRILQVGDASGLQSPLSFGGFGSVLRHIKRLTNSVHDALTDNITSKEELQEIQAYQPSLSVMWMFHKAMSVTVGRHVTDPYMINRLLASNFKTMDRLGPGVMMPFLQDVIQLGGLTTTLTAMSLFDPLLVPPLLLWVGPAPVISFTVHLIGLAIYTILYPIASLISPTIEPLLDTKGRFIWRRRLEAFKYGSGNDY